MSQQDKGLTELIFLAGLVILPLDNIFWGAGLPALVIASALAYGIAWELPRLLFKRGNALDQLSASLALTLVLACFYLGKSDRAVAQIIEQQGQSAAFNSPMWLVNDGVLLALTVAVMMVLLALTTFVLHLFQPSDQEPKTPLLQWITNLALQFAFASLIGVVVGLGGGAWAVLVGNKGLTFGLVTWLTMWATVRGSAVARNLPAVRWGIGFAVAMVLAGLVGGITRSPITAALAGFLGLTVIIAHFIAISFLSYLKAEPEQKEEQALELVNQRPKDAPFHVPWVGFYTLRFAGLVVAFFVVGAGWLWGLR
ncbi:MAG: hypothetical protein N3B10_01725 [Armatimonadetes bacterium]|nr:hypothetical protein [Armatimonadota bacterium]MCX7967187.1 hypothetical protein [Armatimonadota bacterium]MDW8143128.1 hypothetical protein [Armatimonadota bacterium]